MKVDRPIIAKILPQEPGGKERTLVQGKEIAPPTAALREAQTALEKASAPGAVICYHRDEQLFHVFELNEKLGPFKRDVRPLSKDEKASVQLATQDVVSLKLGCTSADNNDFFSRYIVLDHRAPIPGGSARDELEALLQEFGANDEIGEAVYLRGRLTHEGPLILEYLRKALEAAGSCDEIDSLEATALTAIDGKRYQSHGSEARINVEEPAFMHASLVDGIRQLALRARLDKDLAALVPQLAQSLTGCQNPATREFGEVLQKAELPHLLKGERKRLYDFEAEGVPADLAKHCLSWVVKSCNLSTAEVEALRRDVQAAFDHTAGAAQTEELRRGWATALEEVDILLDLESALSGWVHQLKTLEVPCSPDPGKLRTLRNVARECGSWNWQARFDEAADALCATGTASEAAALKSWIGKLPANLPELKARYPKLQEPAGRPHKEPVADPVFGDGFIVLNGIK